MLCSFMLGDFCGQFEAPSVNFSQYIIYFKRCLTFVMSLWCLRYFIVIFLYSQLFISGLFHRCCRF